MNTYQLLNTVLAEETPLYKSKSSAFAEFMFDCEERDNKLLLAAVYKVLWRKTRGRVECTFMWDI